MVDLRQPRYSTDVKRAYQLGANSFLTKPTDFIELVSEVKAMSDFWLNDAGTNAPSNISDPTFSSMSASSKLLLPKK